MPTGLTNTGFGDNYGSIVRLHVLSAEKETNLVAALGSDLVPDDAVLESLFEKIELIPETSYARETEQSDDQGPFFEHDILVNLRKDRPEVRRWISNHTGGLYIIVYDDANGERRMIGMDGDPLLMLTSKDTGRRIGDLNAFDFSFTGRTRTQSAF